MRAGLVIPNSQEMIAVHLLEIVQVTLPTLLVGDKADFSVLMVSPANLERRRVGDVDPSGGRGRGGLWSEGRAAATARSVLSSAAGDGPCGCIEAACAAACWDGNGGSSRF